MEISKIGGIPAHPLFVHIPVMAIPLLALLVIAYVVRPAWRTGLFYPLGGLTIFTMIATLIAAGSGEKLQESLPPEERASSLLHKHTELGDQTKAIVLIFGVVILGYLAIEWYRRQVKPPFSLPVSADALKTIGTVSAGIAIVLSLVAVTWDIRAGHSGAKSAWSNVGSRETATGGGDSDQVADTQSFAIVDHGLAEASLV